MVWGLTRGSGSSRLQLQHNTLASCCTGSIDTSAKTTPRSALHQKPAGSSLEANLRRSFVSTAPVTRPSYVFLYSLSATAIALILLSIVHICAHQAKENHLFHIGLQCLARRRWPGGAQALAPISLKRRNSGDTPALRLARCWALEPPGLHGPGGRCRREERGGRGRRGREERGGDEGGSETGG